MTDYASSGFKILLFAFSFNVMIYFRNLALSFASFMYLLHAYDNF